MTSDEQTYAQLTLGSEVSDNCHKVLGLPWDCVKDEIRFSFIQLVSKASGKCPIKRSVLSLLAGLFNPLGLISGEYENPLSGVVYCEARLGSRITWASEKEVGSMG